MPSKSQTPAMPPTSIAARCQTAIPAAISIPPQSQAPAVPPTSIAAKCQSPNTSPISMPTKSQAPAMPPASIAAKCLAPDTPPTSMPLKTRPLAVSAKCMLVTAQAPQKLSSSTQPNAASMKQAGVLLLDAIYRSHPGSEDELLRAVADVCLASGLQIQSNSQLLLCPVSCCQIGAAVSQRKLTMTGKLQETLESAALKPNFQVIPGPLNQPAAVLPNLAGLISNKHKIPLVRGILANVQVSLIHPKTASDGSVVITVSKQQQPIQPDSSTKQPYEADGVANILIKEVEGTLQCEDQAFVRSVASACITYGLESHASGLQLHPVLLARVGEYCKKMAYDGKLSDKLKTLPCQCCFQLIQGPGQAAVLLNLATLFPGTSARLRQVVKVITKHPKA